jgi:hypothetical protein
LRADGIHGFTDKNKKKVSVKGVRPALQLPLNKSLTHEKRGSRFAQSIGMDKDGNLMFLDGVHDEYSKGGRFGVVLKRIRKYRIDN